MFLYDPVLEVASVLGKMGPWKFHMYNAWMEVCPKYHKSCHMSEEDRATRATLLAKIFANSC